MIARIATALLLTACLFGAAPAFALETTREGGDNLSHAALSASTMLAARSVRADADLRHDCALPPTDGTTAEARPLFVARARPAAHAVCPDVLTCPAQGPPASR